MIDLLQATQDAIFAALDVPAVRALAPVFTSVPTNQQPPFIEVGAIDAESIGGKHDLLEQHRIEIEFQYRGPTRRPLLAMMHAAREALESADLIAPGAALETPRWTASATDREEDGTTYHGLQSYELIAQPDDEEE